MTRPDGTRGCTVSLPNMGTITATVSEATLHRTRRRELADGLAALAADPVAMMCGGRVGYCDTHWRECEDVALCRLSDRVDKLIGLLGRLLKLEAEGL